MNAKIVLAVAFSALATAAQSSCEPGYATLIAHRGESVDAPENTLPAYKTAVERGFGFECDVYLSKDLRVFTFHDRSLARTTAGKCTKKCSEASWEEEISKLDVGGWGKWKGSRFEGTRPALLEEVLDLAVDGRWIYVEVKPGPEIVPYIKKVFDAQRKATPRNVLFISFNTGTCRELKRQMPEYKVFLLLPSRKEDATKAPYAAEEVVAAVRAVGADGIDISFNPAVHDCKFVETVRREGLEFHVWTVDKLDLARKAFAAGAQTLTTNCAKTLLDGYRSR